MTDNLREWAASWGDLASIAGLLVALIGFAATIVGVWRSKTAAQRAKDAADATKALLLRANAIADFSAALSIMEEIRRLQRASAWAVLPDRYSTLREKLLAILESHPLIEENDRVSIGAALRSLKQHENRIEQSLAAGANPPNVPRLNQVIGSHLDTLRGVLTRIQIQIKGERDA
jgi:hypothetical protein